MRGPDGLRVVALLEATKGLLVLLVGVAALKFIHADVQAAAEELVRHFHLNPASQYPQIFLKLAQEATPPHLLALAVGGLAYALIRFVEAYGLWHERRWAEWLAVITGGIYLPIEVRGLLQGITWQRATLLTLNLGIVVYLTRTLIRQRAPAQPRRPSGV
jgi:uncharacterized membrane protein (DUF2068 family)